MKIKFKTISPVILSPRMEKALYKGVDFKEVPEGGMKSLKTGEIGNINMVYPFYSYEDRNLLYENCFCKPTLVREMSILRRLRELGRRNSAN